MAAVVAVMHSGGERGHPLKEGTGIWGQTYNSKKCFMRGLVDDIEVLTEGKLILATGSARACRQALVGPGHHHRL